MKHIAYGETTIATDDRLADLVLEYATLLARSNGADTITIPGRVGGGALETFSILVGPASQITAWHDDVPFGSDVSAAVAEVEGRIRAMSAEIDGSGEGIPPGLDAFDELA